ncbi:hypothetical protein [Haloplanus rallus]|uniref:hypothetical protein n=1 Tax=Haloplanus rallus TaxID=1816183 RepID=UPI001E48276A|nr:hypothetical protein [Haloplanus rallus]
MDPGDDDADADPHDPPRDTTPGRGQGQGVWLEIQLQQALEDWGYATARREPLVALTADVVACRQEPRDEPADYLVAECKDWQDRPIDETVIIRLCLLAFLGRAMPVLCHTSRLTDRAWRLAQAFDVRLLTLQDLDGDEFPPLIRKRPPQAADIHRDSVDPETLRQILPITLCRPPHDQPDADLEAAVFSPIKSAPCYVPDRTGHEDYADTYFTRYRRREHRKRDTQDDDQ